MDEVEHLRHTVVNRALYRKKRQETIERVFAHTKEKHDMRWSRYRELKKTTLQVMLTFIALNLKKLANWSWDSPCNSYLHYVLIGSTYNKPKRRPFSGDNASLYLIFNEESRNIEIVDCIYDLNH